MKKIVVAVSDRAVGAFMNPFTVPSRGAAVRAFSDEVNRADSEMNKHPEDYELHYLSEWDDETGSFSQGTEQKELLSRGKDVIRKVN